MELRKNAPSTLEDFGIDVTSLDFILQNLSVLDMSSLIKDEEAEERAEAVLLITAQVCFFVLSVLKAYQGVIKAPRILIYGPGYLGGSIINALIECGLSSLLRVYVRNSAAVAKWRDRNIKTSDSVSRLLKAGTFELVINCANASSFAQLTRDLQGKVTAKTCVISCSFGIQRNRIYQLLRMPCIFRTFAEHASVFRHNESANLVASLHSSSAFDTEVIRLSASILSSRTATFINHIKILENYYVVWGMSNEKARREAINVTLGGYDWCKAPTSPDHRSRISSAKSVSDQSSSAKFSIDEHVRQFTTDTDDRSGTAAHDVDDASVDSAEQNFVAASAAAEQDKSQHADNNSVSLSLKLKVKRVGILDNAISLLQSAFGVYFQQELSKIATIGDLAEFASHNWDSKQHRKTSITGIASAVYLSEAELKDCYKDDNAMTQNYFIHSEILDQFDAEDAAFDGK